MAQKCGYYEYLICFASNDVYKVYKAMTSRIGNSILLRALRLLIGVGSHFGFRRPTVNDLKKRCKSMFNVINGKRFGHNPIAK